MNIKEDHEKILFNKNDRFLITLRQRVDDYFARGRISPHANWTVHLKTVFIFIACVLIYLSLIFDWLPIIPRIVFWLMLGVGEALFAVNVGHDALHGAYSKSAKVNNFLGFLAYDMIGLSSCVWRQTHNKEHHTYTNIAGADPDIHKPGILRLSPHDPWYKYHSFQYIYIWFLYSLLTLDWVLFSDYAFAYKHRKEIPKKEIVTLVFFKMINLFYMIGIPLMFSSMAWWQVAIGYAAAQLIAGLIVSLIFQLAHLVEGVEFPLPDEKGIVHSSWGSHEMHTTANFSTHNSLMGHAVGGLNFQIEHHLLPKVCHVHYIELAKIVRKTAQEFHFPYHERPSLKAAVASHIRLLKKFGKDN